MFAVQHQGWCASSRTAHLTYRKYGTSNRCRNGKGGPWANDVYVLRGKYYDLYSITAKATRISSHIPLFTFFLSHINAVLHSLPKSSSNSQVVHLIEGESINSNPLYQLLLRVSVYL